MAEILNEAGETWDDDYGLDPKAKPVAAPVQTCVLCKHSSETWNPVTGVCEYDPDPQGLYSDEDCGCRCEFPALQGGSEPELLHDEKLQRLLLKR